MGKKLKTKARSKKNHLQKTIYSIKKTIKIDIFSNRKQISKINPQRKNLNSFLPKKFISLNSTLILKSKQDSLNTLLNDENENIIPKWMSTTTQKIQNSVERFNSEIIDYIDYITPNNFSTIKRKYTIELLTHIIQKYYPRWQVVLYGSFSQNLSTVFSDIDVAIYNNEKFNYTDCIKLFDIMNILENESYSEDIEFINAKIPILRGTCAKTGVSFDISFNKRSGLKAADLVRNVVDNNKIVKQAVIFIKILLKINNLNETYTGGMCSFLVFHLVYYFYIVYQKEKFPTNSEKNNQINVNNTHLNCKSAKYNDFNLFSNDIDLCEKNESTNNSNLDLEDIRSNYSDFNSEENTICSTISDNKKNEKNNYMFNSDEVKIGDFLLNFFKFYGFEFDYQQYGFSINEKNFGKTFEKINGYQENTISVESIEEEEIDIGIKCFNYYKIVDLFQKTYFKIKMERDSNIFSVLNSLDFPENDVN